MRSLEVRRAPGLFHDGPLIFDHIAAYAEKSIVKVHGGVAVRCDQAESVAEADLVVVHEEPSVFVAGEFVSDIVHSEYFGPESAVGSQCLDSGIDDGFLTRAMDDGGKRVGAGEKSSYSAPGRRESAGIRRP